MRFVAAPFIAAIISMSTNSTRADDVWGAVSIADDGGFASTWNRSSRVDALNDVKRRCRENSSLPDSCSDATVTNGEWIAGVKCEYRKRRVGTIRSGQSAKQAIANAFKASINIGAYAKEDCTLKVLIAGDGSHLKYISPNSTGPQGHAR
jgi:hypothetical protein